MAASAQLRGAVALVTVTAPGADWLPWDSTGRRVDADIARVWNRTAPQRWSALHRRAARAARRQARADGGTWRLLMKAWEYQKRGVLHLHLVVPCGSPTERRASDRYVRELAAWAESECFGFVDRGKLPCKGARQSARALEPVAPHRAAAYVAAYLTSTGAGKGGVAEVAKASGVPGACLYVSNVLSAGSGVTMRTLRDRRRVMCSLPGAAGSARSWRAACALDGLLRGAPPLLPDQRAALMQRALAEGWTFTVLSGTGEIRATAAPMPPQCECDAGGSQTIEKRGAVVRLDSVLHRGHESGPWELFTRATVETGASHSTRDQVQTRDPSRA